MKDPFEQLERSHRRHDDEMRDLLAAAERNDRGRIGEALDFFDRTSPRHFADEEESLFPRLIARAPNLEAQLTRLVAEHRDHERRQAELWELYESSHGDAFRDRVRELEEVYRRHVAEEDELFAQVRDVLTPDDIAEVAAGMESRRPRRRG